MKPNESSEIISKSPFIQKHSVYIRVWHWLTFITLSFSMITVLFVSTTFHARENIVMVQQQLKNKGAIVTEDQAWAVAHEYADKMWDLHKYLGIALVVLLFSRIVIELGLSRDEKFRGRLKNAIHLTNQNTSDKKELLLYQWTKWGYILFYLLLFCMSITGLGLAFGGELGLSRPVHHWMMEIHGFIQYLIYGYVFLHLCGVIYADIGKSKGIVSGMIHGRE